MLCIDQSLSFPSIISLMHNISPLLKQSIFKFLFSHVIYILLFQFSKIIFLMLGFWSAYVIITKYSWYLFEWVYGPALYIDLFMHFKKLGSAQWTTVLAGVGICQQQVFNSFSLKIVECQWCFPLRMQKCLLKYTDNSFPFNEKKYLCVLSIYPVPNVYCPLRHRIVYSLSL